MTRPTGSDHTPGTLTAPRPQAVRGSDFVGGYCIIGGTVRPVVANASGHWST